MWRKLHIHWKGSETFRDSKHHYAYPSHYRTPGITWSSCIQITAGQRCNLAEVEINKWRKKSNFPLRFRGSTLGVKLPLSLMPAVFCADKFAQVCILCVKRWRSSVASWRLGNPRRGLQTTSAATTTPLSPPHTHTRQGDKRRDGMIHH